MNLHVLNDEKFFDPFVEKMEELKLLDNNVFVVKERGPLKFIKRKDLVYGRIGDKERIGDVSKYDKVFIHSFTFHLYRWVHQNTFKELNWMIWGKELYESNLVDYPLYESKTKSILQKIKRMRPMMSSYYRKAEQFFLQIDIEKVYNKFDYVLTWIEPEYRFAIEHIKGLKAAHKSFAYTFEVDTEILSNLFDDKQLYEHKQKKMLRCIIGNSGASSNNHLDALEKIKDVNFHEVMLPVSYGDVDYISLLKKEVQLHYNYQHITFADRFMRFDEYLHFFMGYDVFISNASRPIGMGNIWMALLTGKLVFMNSKNLVFPFLRSLGLQIFDIDDICRIYEILNKVNLTKNRDIATNFLSKNKITTLYENLFGDQLQQLQPYLTNRKIS